MRFRKKPVVVAAFQWDASHNMSQVPGVHIERGTRRRDDTYPPDQFYVVTAHGQKAYLADGDWVIAEPDGRGYYLCKPDIFEATYEPVEETK